MTGSGDCAASAGPRARRSGRLRTATGAGTSDHACWAYASDAGRAAAATAWLAEGLRAGQRGLYVADGSAERLAGELAGIPGCAAALEHGALLVVPSARVYDLSAPIDAAAQLRVYAGVVAQAVADGFRGLRVAADITPLVTDPARRPAHLHWEQVADRYMTAHPLAPLCLYDTRRIACIDAIRCAHPLQGPGPVRLALHGTGVAAASLAGDVDATLSHVFGDLLAQLPGTDETLDLSQVSFMDGRSAWILHSELVRRRQAGQRLTVTGAPQVLRRLWGICGFDTSFLAA